MKKFFLFLVVFTVSFSVVFGDNGDQEEVDFLLFQPNSTNQFVDEVRARTQLDSMARYFRTKNLTEAQIYVYGYAADVANDIDPAYLSRQRALHVIGELEKRGIARSFFTAPVGHGSVNLWGNNINEDGRSPNRRVRVLFEDVIITPEVVQEAEPQILAFEAIEEERALQSVAQEEETFPWWWLLLLLVPLLLLFLPKRKSKTKPKSAVAPKYKRLTEEEIRNCAYGLFEERCHQHGFDESDWHNAIGKLTAMYEAQGYIVIWP